MAPGPVATGYVDLGTSGASELRIHGVGGTSPQELLDHPHPVQVAGDATSGFFRRWDTDAGGRGRSPGEPRQLSEHRHVEGFSWGGITSGSGWRALWMLLIPFLLVNVAHWALPGRAAQNRWANTMAQRLLRLLALSLTMTLALAAAETGIDLLGRQCAGTTCFKSAPSWLSALAGHRAVLVCLGALIPVAVIMVLGVLGRSSWKITEKVEPRTGDPKTATPKPPQPDDPALADPLFWAGAEPVRRLRALHLSSGLSMAAVIQVLPVMDSPRRDAAIATLAAAGLVLGTSAVLTVGNGVARPHHRRPSDKDLSGRAPMLMWAAGSVFALALIVDLLPHAVPATAAGSHDLRRLDGLVQALFEGQTALVILLAACVLAAGLQPSAVQAGRRKPSDRLVPPALAVLAWLMAWLFTAGMTVRLAHQLFGNARGAVPTFYIVLGAMVAPGGGLILAGVGMALVFWYRREAARQRSEMIGLPPPAGPGVVDARDAEITRRTTTIVSARTRAGILDLIPQLVVAATSALVLLAVVALILAKASRHAPDRHWVQQLADLGTLILGLAILRFLAMARKAWQQASTRRTVGILWDLGSFWPRAAHPLAPPCYCERALPQLHARLTVFGGHPDDRVVVSGHSQGSVISAALLLMPRAGDLPPRLSLLTYGSPLGRLYGRLFPGYLGPQVLGVGGVNDDRTSVTLRSRSWSWLNLYRETDPVGGYVGAREPGPGQPGSAFGGGGARRTDDIDIVLVDPEFVAPPGDITAARPAGHSHYREDPTYDAAIDELLSAPPRAAGVT